MKAFIFVNEPLFKRDSILEMYKIFVHFIYHCISCSSSFFHKTILAYSVGKNKRKILYN